MAFKHSLVTTQDQGRRVLDSIGHNATRWCCAVCWSCAVLSWFIPRKHNKKKCSSFLANRLRWDYRCRRRCCCCFNACACCFAPLRPAFRFPSAQLFPTASRFPLVPHNQACMQACMQAPKARLCSLFLFLLGFSLLVLLTLASAPSAAVPCHVHPFTCCP